MLAGVGLFAFEAIVSQSPAVPSSAGADATPCDARDPKYGLWNLSESAGGASKVAPPLANPDPESAAFGSHQNYGNRETGLRCPGCVAIADELEQHRHRLAELIFNGSTIHAQSYVQRELAQLRSRLLAHAELCGGGR